MGSAVLVRRSVAVVALSSLLVAGPASAADSTVIADDNFFQPSTKTIGQGDRVRWLNSTAASDDNSHTSTSNVQLAGFTVWNFNLPNGSAASSYVTFVRAGAYGYHCNIHSGMNGTVKVRLKGTRIDANSWTIRMAGTSAPTGFVHELQRRKLGTTAWFSAASTANATARFDAPTAGTWQLRARYRKIGGSATGYSPTLSVTTT